MPVTTPHPGFPVLALLQLLPLAVALLLWLVRRDAVAMALAVPTALTELGIAIYLYGALDGVATAPQLTERWTPLPPLNYHAAVDGLSLLFILLTALLTLLLVAYGPARRLDPLPRLLAVVLAIEGTLMSLLTTLDLLWFLLASGMELWLAGYLLWEWATSPAKDLALRRFYQFMGIGIALLLLGTLMLGWDYAAAHDGTWSFDLTDLAQVKVDPATRSLVFFLLFYGMAVRTPLFPLHGWLPQVAEHGNVAVAPVLLLGVKVGIYGLLRFVFPLLPETALQWHGYVAAFATAGIFYSALLALVQQNLRRLLAFAVVSHTSVLVIGLFSLGHAAFQGSVMLSVDFGLAISGLFLLTGLVFQRTHTTSLDRLGGLFDRLPLIGIAFIVAGLSIVGMPGTPGFDAAHLMLEAAIGRFGALVTIAAALGNVAAAAFLLWAFQRAFLAPRSAAMPPDIPPADWHEQAIAVVLILVLLGAGFYSEPWMALVDRPLGEISAHFGAG
jgi:NADH-quinone oxidoreductase subunit M